MSFNPASRCLGCNKIGHWKKGRCPECTSAKEKIRNAMPKRQAYRQAEYRNVEFPLGSLCFWCNQPILFKGKERMSMSKDHYYSLDAGGANIDNLVASHLHCNSAKSNKSPEEWKKHIRARLAQEEREQIAQAKRKELERQEKARIKAQEQADDAKRNGQETIW
jgi:5-methylcytosine-specific restriction endonuclease McrA